jgi:hypothetical protein
MDGHDPARCCLRAGPDRARAGLVRHAHLDMYIDARRHGRCWSLCAREIPWATTGADGDAVTFTWALDSREQGDKTHRPAAQQSSVGGSVHAAAPRPIAAQRQSVTHHPWPRWTDCTYSYRPILLYTVCPWLRYAFVANLFTCSSITYTWIFARVVSSFQHGNTYFVYVYYTHNFVFRGTTSMHQRGASDGWAKDAFRAKKKLEV